jgi:hypothetical protein
MEKNVCEFCNLSFSTKGNLTVHKKTAKKCMNIQDKITFSCLNCKKTFTSKQRLGDHNALCQLVPKENFDIIQLKCNELENENTQLQNLVKKLQEKNEQLLKELQEKNENTQLQILVKELQEKNEQLQKLQKLRKIQNDNIKKFEQKRKNIPSKVREDVWKKCCDSKSKVGTCFVCNQEITDKTFECGHITSVKEGGSDSIHNLMAICKLCNMSMGTMNLHLYKEMYYS